MGATIGGDNVAADTVAPWWARSRSCHALSLLPRWLRRLRETAH
jgi:hypothetical protein